MAFWGIFGPKNQNCHFMLKFGTYINSSMQNSIMLFSFFVFEWKYSSWTNLFQSIKLVTLCWNLVPRLNQICRIQGCYSLFLILECKWLFWVNLVQNIKIVTSCWNLVPRLLQICRIQWCYSLFLFLSANGLLGHIWSKKSKLSLYAEIWYLH